MKRALIIAAAALSLCGCSTLSLPPASPQEVASQTKVDEMLLMGAEISYKAARSLAEASADAGLIDATAAVKIKAIDSQVYEWLEKARAAYEAGNATDYRAAIELATPLLTKMWALAPGTKGQADAR